MARMIIAGVAMLAVLLAASGWCADARDFYVGGRGGWAPNPVEPFNTWAERNRFQVNDTLVFRYNKDADAVLVVTPSHYDTCNTTQPNLRLAGGHSRFVFSATGPYFFISADAGRCKAGERLIVVVLAVRNNNGGGGNTPSSPPTLSPPVPPPKSSSSSPPPAATPAPRPEPTPPKSPSSPTSSPPPVATPAPPHALAPPPPAGMNASSPSTAPVLAPAPEPAPTGTNDTSSPPSPSSAVALRGGVLACLLIIGSAILV